MTLFPDYKTGIVIKDHNKCKHIIVGDYSYYAGYYHNHPFEDCVMYLDASDNDRDGSTLDKLIIGKFCSIATGVKFMMGGNQYHNHQWIASYPLNAFEEDFDGYQTFQTKGMELKGDTVIGNDVWIGAEALIMPGVKIQDGAVIAARAHVVKDVGPYEIWGGNPARLIKKRFSDADIEKLLKIKWWDWDVAKIKQHLSLLRSSNINALWQLLQKTL